MELDTNIKNYLDDNGCFIHYSRAGFYRITYLDLQDSVLCANCASQQVEVVKGAFIHWEGEPIYCVGCDQKIESEYGVPDN